MATDDPQWVSDLQYRCTMSGLRVVGSWIDSDHEPEQALVSAVRREPAPDELVIGLATVSRLLTIELAAATGRTEREVLRGLHDITTELQRRDSRPGTKGSCRAGRTTR